ncbi:MAG: type II toxin-antitoxin system RelE/ParE family toxin [Deltaproteobacteria bacterium]|nr:type II toxin-antitoxin system RelE/ParE family toxin [Deltaproteobacteria bacterium]
MVEKNRVLFLRPQAQADLDAIRKYSSKNFYEIIDKIEYLKEFPEMGPAMDRAYQGFRQVLCREYRIIYETISDERIEIAYIRHCSRQTGLRLII